MRCKCIVSDMTHNSCHDCDQMFFPEFKELLNYCIEKYNALNHVDDDETETELSSMPMM
ncbi:hypothetical protein [Fibrobacter sp.]|uniref:hypothetical protein n=1 Tax=Fibrobacter sp. TaxID=35828 RepID=UPI00386D7EA0